MHIGCHNTDDRVLAVADLSRNHGGDVDHLLTLVERVSKTGADAIALAAVVPQRQYAADQAEQLAAAERDRLDASAIRRIADAARGHGLVTVVSTSDRETLREVAEAADAWRIDAADGDFGVLLDAAGATGRPVLLDVTRPDEIRIEAVVARVRTAVELGEPMAVSGGDPASEASPTRTGLGVAVMHCPAVAAADGDARDEAFALSEILLLATMGDATGFVDPTPAAMAMDATAVVAATALGVDIVVRSVDAGSIDAFAAMVGAVRRVEAMLAMGAGAGDERGRPRAGRGGARGIRGHRLATIRGRTGIRRRAADRGATDGAGDSGRASLARCGPGAAPRRLSRGGAAGGAAATSA